MLLEQGFQNGCTHQAPPVTEVSGSVWKSMYSFRWLLGPLTCICRSSHAGILRDFWVSYVLFDSGIFIYPHANNNHQVTSSAQNAVFQIQECQQSKNYSPEVIHVGCRSATHRLDELARLEVFEDFLDLRLLQVGQPLHVPRPCSCAP